jgi:hypothetical protein
MIRANKLIRVKWTGHVARMGQVRNAYRILAGKPFGKIINERLLASQEELCSMGMELEIPCSLICKFIN